MSKQVFIGVLCRAQSKVALFIIICLTAAGSSAHAQEGSIFRLKCKEAGIVTAEIGSPIEDEYPYHRVTLYASGLNVSVKDLKGLPGQSGLVVSGKDYKYQYFLIQQTLPVHSGDMAKSTNAIDSRDRVLAPFT